ncbi:MAG: DNA adenine methylase [Polyangiaceae bacterium]
MEARKLDVLDAPCRPFLKWVGGKRQLLPHLIARTPVSFRRYFEPFVGGGALFFNLRPQNAVLADINERLIRTYRGVRDDVGSVIDLLRAYPYDSDFYYQTREIDIDQRSDAEVAAWFIYLNRAGFNGLYRVNRKNRFNVSFGRYTNPTICDADNLRLCSEALRGVELVVADFADVVRDAKRGDFAYFDPPYVPLSATSCFTSYAADGFEPDDQRRLRSEALKLKKRGIHVLLSNSSAPFVRELYSGSFDVFEVSATRMLNCRSDRRGAIKELLVR